MPISPSNSSSKGRHGLLQQRVVVLVKGVASQSEIKVDNQDRRLREGAGH